MKKTLFLGFVALMLGLLSTACIDPIVSDIAEDNEKPAAKKTMVFRATLEQLDVDTKTSLENGKTVVWNEGDEIRVFTAGGNPLGAVFTLASGAGTASASFKGPAIGKGPYYAFYPSDRVPSFSQSPLAFEARILPYQLFATNSFGAGANVSWAMSDNVDDLRFHNVLGAVKFTLKGAAGIKMINLYTRGNELLNGTLRIAGLDGTPTASLTGEVNEGSQFVQIAMPQAVQLNSDEGVAFYLSVPAGTLADGFFVEFIDSAGGAMIKSAKGGSANIIERSVIRSMPAFTYAPQYKSAFLAEFEDFAAYAGVNAVGAGSKECTYTEGVSQYAYRNTDGDPGSRDIRFQDWDAGYALSYQISQRDLPLNSTPTVSVTALGATGAIASGSGTMKVIKKTPERVWLYDQETQNGYVIKLED